MIFLALVNVYGKKTVRAEIKFKKKNSKGRELLSLTSVR